MNITRIFTEFFRSERSGGMVLLLCTVLSLLAANSPFSDAYLAFWHHSLPLPLPPFGPDFTLTHWINDGLMAVFFLLVGLEIRRELVHGELSDVRSALFPAFAAAGGMILPAGLHFLFNRGTPTQAGFGIPMATDIAFALGALSLLGRGVPPALKVFLTALAIIDDLGAILVIAVFYTVGISPGFLLAGMGLFGLLFGLQKLHVKSLTAYFAPGVLMWYCMVRSGVHPTVAGVLLAFTVPYGRDGAPSPATRLQQVLHRPVAYLILPVFALANTGIRFEAGWLSGFLENNSLGIIAGLVIGKPAGILLFSFCAVATGLCPLPEGIDWRRLLGTGCLAGIGFTMSIFVSHIAFNDIHTVNASVTSVLASSVCAGAAGYLYLRSRNMSQSTIVDPE